MRDRVLGVMDLNCSESFVVVVVVLNRDCDDSYTNICVCQKS
jgi:hypothetical protein